MAKVAGAWLVVGQAILLGCLGCGFRVASSPTVTPAQPADSVAAQPANTEPAQPADSFPAAPSEIASATPVEPAGEASVATSSQEESPASPDAPSSPAPELPAAETQATEPPAASPPAATELLHESFADVTGAIQWSREGVRTAEGPPGTRTIYFYHGMPEGGPLAMKSVEDNVTTGPDEQPGVLALSWQELPPQLRYSGFLYLGGRTSEDRLTLPPLKLAKTAADLGQFRLQFRHKVVNASLMGPIRLPIGLRLEPSLKEPYAKRLDLGEFTATGEWGSFEISLAEGKNAEAFLAAIANEDPAAFKINWSQTGPLTNYHSGDTLLIDDIVITQGMTE